MDAVGALLEELQRDPSRFRATGGYERLLDRLERGDAPDALKRSLAGSSPLAGDLSWTIAELDAVDVFVDEALPYLSSSDRGTAAYAMEIVLRGASAGNDLRAAFDQLRRCDAAVCEHAVRTLVGLGLSRTKEILATVGYTWCSDLASKLSPEASPEDIQRLILHSSRDRQVVGAVLASRALEKHPTFAAVFALAHEPWIREYGQWLGATVEPE